jgi:hypothetical protein
VKPILILPPDSVSEADIARLNDNDLCVIVAKDPAAIKFLDPIPAAAGRDKIDEAAIQLSRKLLNKDELQFDEWGRVTYANVAELFVKLVTLGTSLTRLPTADDEAEAWEETFEQIYKDSRADEMDKLGKQDAKAERDRIKAEEAERRKAEREAEKAAAKETPGTGPAENGNIAVQSPLTTRILKFLTAKGTGARLADIVNGVGAKSGDVASAVQGLVAKGEIVDAKQGGFYRLAQTQEATK